MTAEPPKPNSEKNKEEQKKETPPSFTDKLKETYTHLKDQVKDQDFSGAKNKFKEALSHMGSNDHNTTNARDIIAYILLIIGVLLLFYYPAYGQALVGVTVGLYFGHEIFHFLKNFGEEIEKLGIARSLILGGLFLAFFISAPFLFLGAAFAVALRQLLVHDN